MLTITAQPDQCFGELRNRLVRVSVCSVTQLCPTLATPGTVACQIPLPMGFSGKNAGVGSHLLLEGIFQTQESNPGLLFCRQILYQLSHHGSPSHSFSKYFVTFSFYSLHRCVLFIPARFQRSSLTSGVAVSLNCIHVYKLRVPSANVCMGFSH